MTDTITPAPPDWWIIVETSHYVGTYVADEEYLDEDPTHPPEYDLEPVAAIVTAPYRHDVAGYITSQGFVRVEERISRRGPDGCQGSITSTLTHVLEAGPVGYIRRRIECLAYLDGLVEAAESTGILAELAGTR